MTSNPQYSSVSSTSSASNQPIRRTPRGSINRRACQKCRHLKIKCDGDAENNIACSNCDQGTCVYDKSPRKNRQVEKLNNKIENLEKTLTETQNNLTLIQIDSNKKAEEYNSFVDVLKMEKQILNALFDCNLYTEHPIVFNQLRQIISESRCLPILLPVIHTLLIRLSQPQDDNTNNGIIATLRTIVENTMNYCNQDDSFNPSISLPHNFIEEVQLNVSQSLSTGISNLALQSPASDVGSDMSNLSVPEYKILTSPILTPSIDITSPHLTPITPIDEAAYFSHSESEYGSSPVHTSTNDFNQMGYGIYVDQPFTFYQQSSYGSNSNNGQ